MSETSFNHDKLRALLAKAPNILQEIQEKNHKDKEKSKKHEAFNEDRYHIIYRLTMNNASKQ